MLENLLSKYQFFWVNIHRECITVGISVLPRKTWFWGSNFRGKNFWNSFLEKIQILNHFLYNGSNHFLHNGSDSESRIPNVSDKSQLFAARQSWNRNIENELEFEIILFSKVTVSDDNFAFKISDFWSFYTVQTPFGGVSFFLKKQGSEKNKRKKTRFSYQKFYCRSEFESRTLKHVKHRAKFPKLVKYPIDNLTKGQSLNQIFYHPSHFESKILQRIRSSRKLVFRNTKKCWENRSAEKLSFRKSFFGSFYTVETSNLAF